MSTDDEMTGQEIARGSITALGLRNAAFALEEIMKKVEDAIVETPSVIQTLLDIGVMDQFIDEHAQTKLVPDFLRNLADAMDHESKFGTTGTLTMILKTGFSPDNPNGHDS